MKESENDLYNNKSPKLSSGKPYIICAALYIKDDIKRNHLPKNIETGYVVAGRRHHNCYMTFDYLVSYELIKSSSIKGNVIQGFLTSDDQFVDRKEAGKIALECGQIEKVTECLFSEDIY